MNQEAIDILDTHLYGQYAPGTVAIKAYWESVYEQLDGVSSLSDVALTAYMSFFRLGLKNLATVQSNTEVCRSEDYRLFVWVFNLNCGFVQDSNVVLHLFFSCHCRFEPVGYPLSAHLYFYDDRFQGYLIRQEVQSVGSKIRETLEVWAVPQVTLILEPNLKEFERLKNLEVSLR